MYYAYRCNLYIYSGINIYGITRMIPRRNIIDCLVTRIKRV